MVDFTIVQIHELAVGDQFTTVKIEVCESWLHKHHYFHTKLNGTQTGGFQLVRTPANKFVGQKCLGIEMHTLSSDEKV